jgi:RNA polymerase sigma-70 factor (family 1)
MSLKVIYNESELLEKTAMGDEHAFSTLFYAFHQELGDYVFRLTKSLPMAEEIVQDTFVKIWTGREQLSNIKSFRAYLFTLSRNHTFNVLRGEARRALLDQKWAVDLPVAEEAGREKYHERLYVFIDEAIAQLPFQQQRVWRLSREDGLKHEQIAEKLQLSRETVKRHISLAMASITRYVKNHADSVLGIIISIRIFFS